MNTTWNSEDYFWRRTILYCALAALVVVGGGVLYYVLVMKPSAPPQVASAPTQAPPAPPTAAPQPEHHPMPAPPPEAPPLPPMNESDGPLAQALADVFGRRAVEQMLVPDQIIRKIVVTVDNLPRTKVAEQMRPVRSIGGQTITVTSGDTITLSAENYSRYAPIIRIVQNTDIQKLGALYVRWYPLFQQAYEDLGYPDQYFNDRLVEVIDHLLETPDLRGPIELRQGKVFYEFADPALESRSAGQKLLMRMGPDNAAVIKKKLRELRAFATSSQDVPHAGETAPSSASEGGEAPQAASPDEGVQPLPEDQAQPVGPAH